MFFFRQFETFDPTTGDVPAQPFSYLPEIARRARAILLGWSTERIVAAAKRINREVEGYFEDVKQMAIANLRNELQPGDETFATFFEWDGGTVENGQWVFREEMVDELEIPTAESCSEVDALKTIIENRDFLGFLPEGAPEPEPDEFAEGLTHELFAVLGLWQLSDCMEWATRGGKHGMSIAGEFAIKAMDSVCHAEHLREAKWLTSYTKKTSHQEMMKTLAAQKTQQEERMANILAESKERAVRAKTQRAIELNKLRHARTTKAREMVTTEWAKNRSQFPSAEKAGVHFSDWLVKKNVVETIEPRTVTGWIRAHAKQIGVRLR